MYLRVWTSSSCEKIVESKDVVSHESRVYSLCEKFLECISMISDDEKGWLKVAALHHDIGKYFISSTVLNSTRKLSKVERVAVDFHAYLGYLQLKEDGFCEEICLLVLLHHGLDKYKGDVVVGNERIIWLSNILRICDMYDALVSYRPYKRTLSKDEAINIILDCEDIPRDLVNTFVKSI